MSVYRLQRETFVPKLVTPVFRFFSRAENLETLTPPWLHFRILSPRPILMREGATIAYKLRVHGIPFHWLTEIERWDPPFEFLDVQVKGPYQMWRHTHRFFEVDGGTRIVDIVDYALPLGPFGRAAHQLLVARDLSAIFDYRQRRIRALLG